MHATPTGYVVEPWKRIVATRRVVAMYRCTIPLDDAVKDLAEWLGTRYNYAGVFGAAIQAIAALFGRRIRNPLNDARKLYCSEAIVRLVQFPPVPRSVVLVPESTSPERLLSKYINVERKLFPKVPREAA